MASDTARRGLGITGYHSVEFYVKDLDSVVNWHVNKLDFAVVAKSTAEHDARQGMRSVALKGSDDAFWIFTTPLEPASSAGRYLSNHPDGVGFLNFKVRNIADAALFLAENKAPFLYDVRSTTPEHGTGKWQETAIATPIGDVGFRFIEEQGFNRVAPGLDWTVEPKTIRCNRYKFLEIDHVTINTRCLPAFTSFCKEVLGFEQYWAIDFHTLKVKPDGGTGSGLESVVMWDPHSNVKFATNQPLAPYFNNSQIQIYVEDNRGAGVQHLALSVPEIIGTVDALRKKDVRFLDAPEKYYKQLPKRLADNHITNIAEPMDRVQAQGILVDGHDGKYLLQLFMTEMVEQLGSKQAGPFFYEIIQRCGDKGFGDGNFKALFDSIEQGHVAASRQEMRDRIDSLL